MKGLLFIVLVIVLIEQLFKGIWSGLKEMWSYWRCYISIAIKDYKMYGKGE